MPSHYPFRFNFMHMLQESLLILFTYFEISVLRLKNFVVCFSQAQIINSKSLQSLSKNIFALVYRNFHIHL